MTAVYHIWNMVQYGIYFIGHQLVAIPGDIQFVYLCCHSCNNLIYRLTDWPSHYTLKNTAKRNIKTVVCGTADMTSPISYPECTTVYT